MELFRPQGEKQDLLFISTERYKFCVLSFDAEKQNIITRANGDIEDRIARPADVGQIGIIDPECRMIGLHLYDGLFKVIPFDQRNQLKEAFNIRLEELMVMDIKFLHGCSEPTIALIHEDTKEHRHLKTFTVSLKDKELIEGTWKIPNIDPTASRLIPVPAPFGGLIIISEQSITYANGQTQKSIAMNATNILAYGRVDANGSRWLLGDLLGVLYVLVLQNDGNRILDLKLERLGETSIASTISYLDNGVVYIGSFYGDSQLIKLNSEKDENNSFITPLENYTNLGPIVDFVVVDLDRQGQGQVVTCSGAYKDGSLRIIRNGIGINAEASIDLPGIKGIWSLKPSSSAQYDKYLIVSFVGATRVLAMTGEELEETEIPGFNLESQTLYCGNVANDQLLQVTSQGINLVHATTLQLSGQWVPPAPHSINVAACNSGQVIVSYGGNTLVYLEIQGQTLKELGQATMENDISCLDISPLGDKTSASVCTVGLWTDISVRVLKLPDLSQVSKELLGGEIIPRSILFATFDGLDYLLCALGDGHLFTFNFDAATNTLSERKKLSLGTQPILLSKFKSKNAVHVFASSDRPTVIYSNNKKLLYSNVNLKEVVHMSPFNSESFPDSLALATENTLTIGTIDEIQKLHIRTIPLGEMPRRIAHQETSRTFLVVTMKSSYDVNGYETEQTYIHLFDDQTFEKRFTYPLDTHEQGWSVTSVQFADDQQWYYVVGTAYSIPTESEPTKGRLLVFSANNDKLHLVVEKEVKGAVYHALPFAGGKLIAAINSKIQIFSWVVNENNNNPSLKEEASKHGHMLALHLVTRGEFIVVGDMMKSISVYVYKPVENTIEEIAKDYNPNWMNAVEALDDDTFIGTENSMNLFVVHKNSDAATDEERGKLEMVGEFHLGEFVNRFRHGSLMMKQPESEAANIPTMIFGSVNGVIGVIATLPKDLYEFLYKLQQRLVTVIKGVGGFTHEQWRSFHNERKTSEARNFIDGDLIELFLDLKHDKMLEVVKGLDVSVEETCKRIESLTQAIH
eukprot:Phypoly_transcript_01287.p1 GENE.Phypoly_transcript_01287~~Phypoly_transcript_01287.p1  ORF type:complete len:1113 (+),score=155.47 Phypoly_transcript_01287:258-3341(+)